MMKNLYIGIDIGGSKIKSVVIDERNKPLRFFEIRYDNKKLTSAEIKKVLIDAVEKLKIYQKRIISIGVAFPSLIIDDKPYFLHINPALKKIQVAKFLKQKFGAPVFIENDVNLAALGEWFFGFKGKPESLFLINLGTGCGSGFIKEGQLCRGYRSSSFELGHMDMPTRNAIAIIDRGFRNNFKCACGFGYNHIECYLSSQFFKLRGLDSFKEAKKAAAGNKKSLNLFKKYGCGLGYVVSNIFTLLEPEIVIITGGLADLHKFFLKDANQICLENKFLKEIRPDFKIQVARSGDQAGILGAALWATGKYN